MKNNTILKLKKLACGILFFSIASIAIAESNSSVDDKVNQDLEHFYESSDSEVFSPRKPATSVENSTTLRAQREGGLAVGYGLLTPHVPGFQLRGYHSVLENLHVGLIYASARLEKIKNIENTNMIEIQHALQKSFLFGIEARYFLLNSLYLSAAVVQRELIFEAKASSIFYNYRIENKSLVKGQMLSLGFGNQWEWDSGIFLDFEWYAFQLPFNSKSTSESNNFGPDSASINAQTKSDLDRVNFDISEEANSSKNATYKAIMLSLGYSY